MVRKRIDKVDIVNKNSQHSQQHGRRAPLLETINALSVDSDPEYSDNESLKHITIDDDILDEEEDEEFERMLQQSAEQPDNNNKELQKSSPQSKDIRFLMECRSRRPLEQNVEKVLDSENSWNQKQSTANGNNKRSVRFNSDVQITSVVNHSTSAQQQNKIFVQNIEPIPECVSMPFSVVEKTKTKEKLNFFERIRDNISSTRESKKKKDSKEQSNNTNISQTNSVSTVPLKESSNHGALNTREVKAKSILKDPLCAKLRSEISTGQFSLSSFSQLENEIDALLCGEKKNKQICDITTKQRILPRAPTSSNIGFSKQNFSNNRVDIQVSNSSEQNSVVGNNNSELALNTKSTNNKAKALKRCSISAKMTHNELPALLQSNQYLYQFRPGSPSLFDSLADTVPRFHIPTPPSSDQFLSNIREEIHTPQVKESSQFFEPDDAQLEYSMFVDPVTGPSINRLMEHLSRNYASGQEAEDCLSISTRSVPENHIYEEILYECLERNSNSYAATSHRLSNVPSPSDVLYQNQHAKNSTNFNEFIAGTSQQDSFQNATII